MEMGSFGLALVFPFMTGVEMIFGASMVGGITGTLMNHGIGRDDGIGVSSETIIGMKRCYRIDIVWRRS